MLDRLQSCVKLLILCGALAAALSPMLAAAQNNELSASVDRHEISVEETLTLRVRYNGQASSGSPDFAHVGEHFDILSQQRSNQMRVFNGVMESYTEWTLTLAPKRTGELLIPSFKFNGHFSEAIQVAVTPARAAPDQLRDIFIETEIDRTQLYVQQQLILTYRLYTTRGIDSLDAEPLQIDGVTVEPLPQGRFQRRIRGTNYGVLEVSYALFPQTSDNFTIPSLLWSLRVASSPSHRGFGFGTGRYELKRLRTEEQSITVASRPNSFPAGETWLPARQIRLSEEWDNSLTELRVGEPITRTIRMRAEGLTAAQLPPLPIDKNPRGYKLYPDQPAQDNNASAEGITGTRTETMALVPSDAGELTLPAIEVTWWDTEADQLRRARLPEKTYFVQGPAGSPSRPTQNEPAEIQLPELATTKEEPARPDNPIPWWWPLLTGVFAVLWLLFMGLWWRARGTAILAPTSDLTATENGEKTAFRRLQQTAPNASLPDLRRGLLQWAAHRWPDQPPQSLQALGLLINEPAIIEHLQQLDAALFGDEKARESAQVDTAALVATIALWRKKPQQIHGGALRLRPLY